MNLELYRYSSNNDDTLGLLFVDGRFYCYTLEDEARNEKKYGETRIPAGTYDIELRTVGGFHKRYSLRFPGMHKGMLQLKDVPNFEYILIHIGNDDDDTAGCLLVGNTGNNNQVGRGFVGHSEPAYRRLYPVIAKALQNNEQVKIKIMDWDLLPFYG